MHLHRRCRSAIRPREAGRRCESWSIVASLVHRNGACCSVPCRAGGIGAVLALQLLLVADDANAQRAGWAPGDFLPSKQVILRRRGWRGKSVSYAPQNSLPKRCRCTPIAPHQIPRATSPNASPTAIPHQRYEELVAAGAWVEEGALCLLPHHVRYVDLVVDRGGHLGEGGQPRLQVNEPMVRGMTEGLREIWKFEGQTKVRVLLFYRSPRLGPVVYMPQSSARAAI